MYIIVLPWGDGAGILHWCNSVNGMVCPWPRGWGGAGHGQGGRWIPSAKGNSPETKGGWELPTASTQSRWGTTAPRTPSVPLLPIYTLLGNPQALKKSTSY